MGSPSDLVKPIRDWAQWLPNVVEGVEDTANRLVPDSLLEKLGIHTDAPVPMESLPAPKSPTPPPAEILNTPIHQMRRPLGNK